MPTKIGDGEFETPDDITKKELLKAQQESLLNPKNHQYISIFVNGSRIDLPLQKFIARYGDPRKYDPNERLRLAKLMWAEQ